MHGFAKVYVFCLYLRCTNANGIHTSKLLCAKSKIAQLKVISVPHLELSGAVLLAILATKIISKLQLRISKRDFRSDTNVVLAWTIVQKSTKWRTLCSHRVREIRERNL